MDKPKVTPKDFFLWTGAMVALYWSVISFLFLLFSYIDYSFPNALSYMPNPYDGGMPYEMASILVLFPIYVLLMWLIRKDIVLDPTRKEIWVRRWALILTLFVAGVSVAIDVIVLLTSFFRGEELTAAFLLKVFTVLLVAALGFMHFYADLRGYWEREPKRKRLVCSAVSLLALVSVFAGFFIVGTPQQARLSRFDDQKVTDLQNIQWQITSYWQSKQKLPGTLSDLSDSLSGYVIPVDSQTGAAYEYALTGTTSFKLCADFNRVNVSSNLGMSRPVLPTDGPVPGEIGGWAHEAGHQCFERSIDPERYPPIKR